MKNLRTVVACICLALIGFVSSAQQNDHAPLNEPNHNKPKIFNDLPERIELSAETVSSLFAAGKGGMVSISSSTDRSTSPIEGVVVSQTAPGEAIQTVIVRSTNFNGANLVLSRFIDAEGQVQYSGRIISIAHGDAYVLKNEEGQFVLVRKKLTSLLNE
jgi:hypothetical protein